jgi:glycine cleavage system H lipoate-binding protein
MGTGLHNIIPEGENHCVWMDAGLVNYKLCDKNFDCESCPFDVIVKTQHHAFAERAMMQSEPETAHTSQHDLDASEKIFNEVIHHLIAPLKKISLPSDRLYFTNHSWVKKMSDGQCRIGIDGFLAHLLNPLMGVVVINTPAQIEKESPFAWIIRDDETFSLHSSVAGSAVQTNTLLATKPLVLTNDPYEQGWILMLAPQRAEEAAAARCYSPEDFYSHLDNDIQRIESLLNSTLMKQRKEIGSTLFDGGVRIETIEQFIGEKRYTQLLSRLLHPHSR